MQLQTPILFLIFNRPDTTKRVFDEIKKQKPKYLYIASDWPRENKQWENEIVEKTRKMVIDQIDRDCEVKTLFREKNLWCKIAVSQWISRFFENVEEWIILEDDCLPDQSFFGFCETMLEKYKDDTRIMHISGDCFLPKKRQNNKEYFFSYHNHIWGWATWKRAWKMYDPDIKTLPEFKKLNLITNITSNFFSKRVWLHNFELVFDWKHDTWDYQWTYCMRSNNGLAILPWVNLISNIWFSPDALHTKNETWIANLPTKKIDYQNLTELKFILADLEKIKYTDKKVFQSFKQYIAILLKKFGLYKIVAKILWYN